MFGGEQVPGGGRALVAGENHKLAVAAFGAGPAILRDRAQQAGDRLVVHEQVEQARFFRHAEVLGDMPLRVTVHQGHGEAAPGQSGGNRDRGGGFSHAAFFIHNRNSYGHIAFCLLSSSCAGEKISMTLTLTQPRFSGESAAPAA